MIFNELAFFLFFLAPSVVAFHKSSQEFRPWIMVGSGLIFFIYFGHIHFGGLWGSLAVLIFGWELLTSRLYKPGSRWCLFGIVQAVAILAAFKYLVFFHGALNDVLSVFSLPPVNMPPHPLLPLGISFFTFEFIHFAADTYRGLIPPIGLKRYAAFIFFMPSMVAGPIKRYQDFGAQLELARFKPELASRGITRILAGLAKKHFLADTFTLWSNKLDTTALYQADCSTLIGWILAYGMKIYFDFSGYSDIAIGSGYLFGITIPENFNWPYLSRNITEFWRRWHISLGSWIFDYIYMPMWSPDHGVARTFINLLLTFALSGLWHGAAYNFVAWGIWHGALLGIHQTYRHYFKPGESKITIALSTLLTFFAVNLGWALFCMDISRASFVFKRLLGLA